MTIIIPDLSRDPHDDGYELHPARLALVWMRRRHRGLTGEGAFHDATTSDRADAVSATLQHRPRGVAHQYERRISLFRHQLRRLYEYQPPLLVEGQLRGYYQRHGLGVAVPLAYFTDAEQTIITGIAVAPVGQTSEMFLRALPRVRITDLVMPAPGDHPGPRWQARAQPWRWDEPFGPANSAWSHYRALIRDQRVRTATVPVRRPAPVAVPIAPDVLDLIGGRRA